MSKKSLEARARRLAAKFVEEAQKLFDDDAMTYEIYDDGVMQALVEAQSAAQECAEYDA